MQPCSLMKKCRIQAFMCFHWGLASLLLAALSSIMYHKNELFFFCGGCKEKILRNTMFLGAWHAPLYLTLSVYPSVRPSVCLFVCLSVCRSVGPSVRPSLCRLSICPSICSSIRTSVANSEVFSSSLIIRGWENSWEYLRQKCVVIWYWRGGGGSHPWR